MGSACGSLMGQKVVETFDTSLVQDVDLEKAVNLNRSGMIGNQKKALIYMLKIAGSNDEKLREKLVNVGCLDTCLPQLRSSSKGVQLIACKFVGKLALSENNRVRITQEGGIPPICVILADPLLATKLVALETLYALAQYPDSRPKIVEENAIKNLIPLLEKHTLEIELACLALLSRLCQHRKCWAKMIRDGLLPSVFEILKSTLKSVKHKKFASIVVAELCNHVDGHKDVIVVDVKRGPEHSYKINGVKTILDVASHYTEEIKIQGSFALARLAENPTCTKVLMQHNAIPLLIEFMKSGKLALQKNGASAVRALTQDALYQVRILKEGVMPPLIRLARCGNDILEASASLALAQLASNIVNRPSMLRKGAFKPILYNARFGHTQEIKNASLTVLCSLWHTEAYRKRRLIKRTCEKFRELLARKIQKVKKGPAKKKFQITGDSKGLGQDDPDEGASQGTDDSDFE